MFGIFTRKRELIWSPTDAWFFLWWLARCINIRRNETRKKKKWKTRAIESPSRVKCHFPLAETMLPTWGWSGFSDQIVKTVAKIPRRRRTKNAFSGIGRELDRGTGSETEARIESENNSRVVILWRHESPSSYYSLASVRTRVARLWRNKVAGLKIARWLEPSNSVVTRAIVFRSFPQERRGPCTWIMVVGRCQVISFVAFNYAGW